MTWLLAVVLKPAVAVLLFFAAYVVARLLWPLLPDGPVKRFAYDRTIRPRHPWKFAFLAMGATWGVVYLVYLLTTH